MTHGLEWTHEVRGESDAVVYRLQGVLGETTDSFDFLNDVRDHMKESPKHLVINLHGVEMITSSGIAIIASCLTDAKTDDRTLALCSARQVVHRALDLTGFANMIPNFDSEAEALAASD